MRRIARVTVWTSALALGLLLIAIGAIAFVLTTQPGLRMATRLAAHFSGGRLQIGAVEGALAGSDWHDVEYADAAGLRVRIKSVRLRAVPREAWAPRLHVELLQVDGFELDLPAPKPHEPRTAPLDLPRRLRFDAIVDSLVVTNLSLKQAGAEFLHLERAEARAQWLGEEIEVFRLAGGLKQSGPLEIAAKLSMHDDVIDLANLSIKGPGELVASGALGLEKSKSDLKLSWRGAHWPLVVVDAPPGIADVAGDAHFTGPIGEYRFDLTAAAIVQKIPAKLDAHGAGSLRDVKLEQLHLQAEQGSADLNGAIAWAPALRADVDGRIQQLNPAVLAPDWPGLINGTVQTKTTLRDDGTPEVAFTVAIDQSKLRDQAFAAKARGRTNLESARFDELIVKTGGGSLNATGDVEWQPALSGNLDAQLSALNPGAFLPGWAGRLNGTAQLRTEGTAPAPGMDGGSAARGRTPEPQVRFAIDLKNSELRGYPLTAIAHGSWRAPALRLDDLALASGSTRLTASGQATSPFDLAARVQSPDLAALYPDLGGTLDADVKLIGPLERPHLVAHASGRALRFHAYRAGTLTLDADVDPAVPSHVDLALANADLGVAVPSAKLAMKGTEKYQYTTLDAHTERGDVGLTAEGGYDRKRYEWGGYITALRVQPRNLPEWKLEKSTPTLLGRARQSIEKACLSGDAGRGCMNLEQNVTGQGLRLYWDLEQLQLAAFKPLLPSDTKVQGKADGDGFIEIAGGDVAAIEAEMRLSGARVERANLPPLEVLPSRIKADQRTGRLHAIADLKLAQGAIAADVSAEPGATFSERALSGQIRVDVPDLGFVEHFSSQLRDVGGRVNGSLALAGTAGRPRLRGDVVLADGHTRLVTPGITVQQINLKLSGNGEGPLAFDGSMHSGEGAMTVGGRVDPAQAAPRADVTLKGEKFQAVSTPDARIWVTPDLHLVSDDTGVHLDGSLTVPQAEITPRKGVGDEGVAVSGDQVMVGVEPKAETSVLKFYSAVKIALGDKVRFNGFGLTTDLGGAVTIYEEPQREASAQGTLYLTNGSYKAYGQKLDIETGRLIFDGGPVTKPAVDLYATRHPQSDVTVGVRVRGTLNRPQLSLQSDPAMPREEQLSWLVLGRPLDATSSSDRSALTQAALTLGLSGGDYFAQRLGKGVGLDTLTIGGPSGNGSAVAADAGTIQGSQASLNRGAYQDQTQAAQLTLGKYLTPKLFVSYGVSLFQQGQTFRLQYDLGRGFKLQSESGGVATGADLIYTFERGH